jgi:transposase
MSPKGAAPKSNRNGKRRFSRKLYRTRHFVENFFCKIKRYRRVATCYDKTSANFLGFVLFAAVRCMAGLNLGTGPSWAGFGQN